MRTSTLGRWAARIVAVAAVGVGAFGAVAAVGVADVLAPDVTVAVEDSSSTSSSDSAADGHEWT